MGSSSSSTSRSLSRAPPARPAVARHRRARQRRARGRCRPAGVRRPRAPGVGGPLVLGPVAEHEPPDRRGLVEVVMLAEQRPAQPAVVGDPAVVGRFEAGQDPQQGGLAVTVAADDADPVAALDAEADVGEQRPDAVRLGDAVAADQVRRVGPAHVISRAPGTGPLARCTVRHSPEPDRATARSTAWSASEARNRQVGPEPDTREPRAPYSSPSAERTAQGRPEPQGRRLEIVVQGRADRVRVAAAQRGHQVLRHGRLGDLAVAAHPVELGVDLGRRQASVGVREHPLVARHGRAPTRCSRHGRCRSRCRRTGRTARRCRARPRASTGRRAWRSSPTAHRRRPAQRPRPCYRRPDRRPPRSSCGC